MNEDLVTLNKWLIVNVLTLNVKKTRFMTFKRVNLIDPLPVIVNGSTIDRVSDFTYLGLWIDSKLALDKKHVDKIKRNVIPFVAVVWKDIFL